jgi:tetratricopeptide (TPR) repeat protein
MDTDNPTNAIGTGAAPSGDAPSLASERTLEALSLRTQRAFAIDVVALLRAEGVYAERVRPEAFDRARTTFQALSTIGDIDTLRKTLSGTLGLEVPDGENRTREDNLDFAEKLERDGRSRDAANAEVAAFLYGELLERFGDHVDRGTALLNIEWLLFIDRYCGDLGGLEDVGTLLRGLAHYATGRLEARDDFAQAAQMGRDKGAPTALLAAAACAVAHERSGAGDGRVRDALKALDDADDLIDGSPGLRTHAAGLRAWIEERDRHVAALLGESDPGAGDAMRNAIVLDLYRPIHGQALIATATERSEDAVKLCEILDAMAERNGCVAGYAARLGQVSVFHNAWATGEALLRSAQARGLTEARLHVLLARALTQQGRVEEALEVLRDVIECEPKNADAWRDLGIGLLALEAPEPAWEALSRAIEFDPEDQIAAIALRSIPRPVVSLDAEAGILNIPADLVNGDPETTAVIITAAIIKAMPGDLEENLQHRASERGPAFVDQVRAAILGESQPAEEKAVDRAKRLFHQRRLVEAKKAYAEAIAEDPDDSYPYLGLGDCHYMLGEFHLAAAYFEESIAVQPTTSAWRFLGDAYRKVGRRPQARAAYESALILDPNYHLARKQLDLMVKEDATQ